MEQKKTYRRPNGRRVDGFGLAAKVAHEIVGMMLAQAFVVTRAAGLELCVNKLDGVPHPHVSRSGADPINVDVVGGFVRKSWALRAHAA